MNLERPWVIAHRGSSFKEPENTLRAFERALNEGADGLELDVWRCASGEIVVTHNRDLSLITRQPGDVEKKTLTELRQLDFGQGEKIPTLEEVLEFTPRFKILNIELKGKSLWSNGVESLIYELLRKHDLLDRTILSSFNPMTLYRLKRISPKIRLGLIFYGKSTLPLRRAWGAFFLNLTSFHPAMDCLNSGLILRARRKNQKVIAWTINNIHDLETCMSLGVHGMITDDPHWMINALKKGT